MANLLQSDGFYMRSDGFELCILASAAAKQLLLYISLESLFLLMIKTTVLVKVNIVVM